MTNNNEVWKKIPGSDFYEISTHGRVRSLKHKNTSGKVLKHGWHSRGYENVTINISGKRKTKSVHRLMGITFLNVQPEQQINHIDGNKKNNMLSNLEVCDAFYNQRHSQYVLKNKIDRKLPHEKTHEIAELYKEGCASCLLVWAYGCTRENIYYYVKTLEKER